MKFFTVVYKHDITTEMINNTGLANTVPVQITIPGASDDDPHTPTDYFIISLTEQNADAFKGYLRCLYSSMVVKND